MKRNTIKIPIDSFINLGLVGLGIMYLISAVMLLLMMLFDGKLINLKTLFYVAVYFSISVLLIRFKNFFQFHSKLLFIAVVIIMPFGIFLAGNLDGDERFTNVIQSLRFVPFALSLLPALISFVLANTLFTKMKCLIKSRIVIACLLYGFCIFWIYTMDNIIWNPYFRGALYSLIPLYVVYSCLCFNKDSIKNFQLLCIRLISEAKK